MAQTLEKHAVAAPRVQEIPWTRRAAHWLERAQPFLYLLPALLAIGIWVYRPLLQTLELSFYRWNLLPTKPKVFVGLENYAEVLSLPEMGTAVVNSLIYVVGLLPLTVLVPLAIAILVSDISGRARSTYRAIIFLPVLMPPVVVAVIWRWLLHPTQGLVTNVLGVFGIGGIDWFHSETLAIWAIMGISAWSLLGFSFLIFSAGLAGISSDYYDAAGIDGASKWQMIRFITLPLVSPTITFMTMMTVLLSAQWVFPLINVLTQGGPFDATTNLYYLMWDFGFRTFAVGWSSAAAVLYFVVFVALAWVLIRFVDRFSIHEA